ncbi:MAG TPA: uroporphyrinogen-III C-methyltransferase [Gemmatimonadaceae bacterium]|nr:uroporphyrinogen-III C-methyltransferase [Gemmatimonadaceae bacterium]
MTRTGTVFLVGAGPGDPGLLTVRARDLLESCDAIVYDALANPALLPSGGDGQGPELHDVGKRGGQASMAQQDISALLVRLGREGKRVVRLKGGDPFVFGRGSEEALALRSAGIPFEVVPGVTAGIAAPAYAGIPVTHRGVATSVTFVTGHEDATRAESTVDWQALARGGGTIVLYMGVRTLPSIADALIKAGMSPDTPAAAVQWGTWPRQRTVVATVRTLADRAREAGLAAPAITIIGAVVELRERIAWFDKRPLFGLRVVVTRASAQASSLTEQLRAAGADVLELPATRTEPLDLARLREALARLSVYDWVAFTSGTAVRIFWEVLREQGLDARALAGAKLCVVGPATAEALLERGLAADVLPQRFVAEGLLESLKAAGDLRGARVLYTAAEGAREVLPIGLRELGAAVDVVPLYRTVPDGGSTGAAEVISAVEAGRVDVVTFTSASSVNAYVDAVGPALASRVPAATIGPVTTAAARSAGIDVVVEATESTIAALVSTMASQLDQSPERPLSATVAAASAESGGDGGAGG